MPAPETPALQLCGRAGHTAASDRTNGDPKSNTRSWSARLPDRGPAGSSVTTGRAAFVCNWYRVAQDGVQLRNKEMKRERQTPCLYQRVVRTPGKECVRSAGRKVWESRRATDADSTTPSPPLRALRNTTGARFCGVTPRAQLTSLTVEVCA